MVGHDDEAVELETVFVTMMEESCDEELGVGCALEWRCCWKVEIVIAYVFCFWRIVAIERKHTPGAKAPLWRSLRGPSLKAWRT